MTLMRSFQSEMIILMILKQNTKWSTLTCRFQGPVMTQLECYNLNNAQYNRRETFEINPVSSDIAEDVLEHQCVKHYHQQEYQ